MWRALVARCDPCSAVFESNVAVSKNANISDSQMNAQAAAKYPSAYRTASKRYPSPEV
jgi:hypothetical protein